MDTMIKQVSAKLIYFLFYFLQLISCQCFAFAQGNARLRNEQQKMTTFNL